MSPFDTQAAVKTLPAAGDAEDLAVVVVDSRPHRRELATRANLNNLREATRADSQRTMVLPTVRVPHRQEQPRFRALAEAETPVPPGR